MLKSLKVCAETCAIHYFGFFVSVPESCYDAESILFSVPYALKPRGLSYV